MAQKDRVESIKSATKGAFPKIFCPEPNPLAGPKTPSFKKPLCGKTLVPISHY